MGQYYMCYTEKINEVRIFDNMYKNAFVPAKLMEHSWWKNKWVGAICNEIYHNPMRIAWVGDYSNDINGNKEVYDKTWNTAEYMEQPTKKPITLRNKYLVNHTAKLYLNCNKYYRKSVNEIGRCIHPLPLLTCVGNGMGGGDFTGKDTSFVGAWYMDEISVEDKIPNGYLEENIVFKEE